ncbi:hypothetical protein [Microvirga sp. VF16]|uniref:hypothetical protein n=1 Tax=Microvirga sp. VF16 TaxID=2807101 RepID=UPI00193EA714|nr:hypothetical protein [Microvirga sp. VF16]QRM28353.1 hypothetical protein JO965_19240 [Microvirga sp. VF16]
MNTTSSIVGHAGVLVTPYSLTASFLIPNENLSYYEVSFTSDLTEADAGPAALPLDIALFGGRFDVGHARIRAMIKALQAGDRRMAAANAKMVSEIYGVRCYVVITDHHGDLLEQGVRSSGIENPDEARRMFLDRVSAVQPAASM